MHYLGKEEYHLWNNIQLHITICFFEKFCLNRWLKFWQSVRVTDWQMKIYFKASDQPCWMLYHHRSLLFAFQWGALFWMSVANDGVVRMDCSYPSSRVELSLIWHLNMRRRILYFISCSIGSQCSSCSMSVIWSGDDFLYLFDGPCSVILNHLEPI